MKLNDHALEKAYVLVGKELDNVSSSDRRSIGELMCDIVEKGIEIYLSALPQTNDPFGKAAFSTCEPHLSGYRVCVGFTSLKDAQEAQKAVVSAFASTTQEGTD